MLYRVVTNSNATWRIMSSPQLETATNVMETKMAASRDFSADRGIDKR